MNKKIFFTILLAALIAACAIPPHATPQSTVDEFENLVTKDCPKKLPTFEPKPEFLIWTSPTGFITKAEYDKLSGTMPSVDTKAGGIQIEMSARGVDQSIVERTDNDRGSTLSKRVTLLINGLVVSKTPLVMDGLMSYGPFYFYWVVNLNPGYYEATLVFDIDASKTVIYRWGFCIKR